jgi:hypothetical protein
LNTPRDAICERYRIERDHAVLDRLFQRFNIAPSQPLAAVRLGAEDGRRGRRRKPMFDDPDCDPQDLTVPAGSGPGDRPPLVIPTGPCEGCVWRENCALQFLACRIFLHFVSKGTNIDGRRRPNRATYHRLFGPVTESGNEPGESSATLDWIDDLPAP